MSYNENLLDITTNPELYRYKWVGEKIYPLWKENNGVDKNWIEIFQIRDPIQFIASEERFLGYSESEGSGYVRPYFRFIDQRILAVSERLVDYKRMVGNFNLMAPKEELLNKVSSYRDKLFTQIERQSDKVDEINSEILNLLKVIFHEAVISLKEETDTGRFDANQFPELRLFGRDSILRGANLEMAKSNWVSVVEELDAFISKNLIESTTAGLNALLKKRESYLKMAEDLARDILPLETIIEQVIIGNEFSENDLNRMEMPNPWEIAKVFRKGATRVDYSTRTISEAMTITREYILEHQLSSLHQKVEKIVRIVNEKVTDQPDRKTIRKWINFYAQEAFLSRSND